MSDLAETIATIRTVGDRVGLLKLAREADVPYTTVRSFAARDWSHKNLDVLQKLADAAKRLDDEAAP